MRKQSLLALSGFTRERFDGLARNENTPFPVSKNEKVTEWADYTLDHAFELRVMGQLMGISSPDAINGLLAGVARKVVSNAISKAERRDPWFFAGQASPIFLGVGEFKDEAADGTISHRTAWVCQPLEGISSWMAKETSGDWGGETSTLNRIVLVNATEAARHVLKKAVALGLIEPGRATE